MVRGVKCDLSGDWTVRSGLCLHWYAIAVSGQFVSPLTAGNWQLIDGTFPLDKSGGYDVLLINGLVSEFGDSWHRTWTSATAGLFYWIDAVLTYSIYIRDYAA